MVKVAFLTLIFIQSILAYSREYKIRHFKNTGSKIQRNYSNCDFEGQIIKGVTYEQHPFVILNHDCINNFHVKHHRNIYSCISGIITDVMNVLAQKCNFTLEVELLTISNEGYGDVIESQNGTFQASGLFREEA